ncbi:putative Cathepsin B [Blattamonas nauphoetae]|nr:putative Cathepsin B [Blattamonas nauphoetae]
MFCLFAAVFANSIVEIVNSDPSSTWVAVEYPASVMNRAKFIARLGTYVPTSEEKTFVPRNDHPTEFFCSDRWGDKIMEVRDQASCGSCWAFSVAETVGDRLNILGCGRGHMSTQDLVSCDTTNYACNGGYMDRSWKWIVSNGITSEKCLSYKSGGGRVPACPTTCDDGSAIERVKAKSWKQLTANEMMDEMMNNGPLSVAFTVYSDFMSYRSGVYIHKTGGVSGGHAVLAVGWGVEDGTPYWLCQNSWGKSWGEAGHFKILRGQNHCGIEGTVTVGYFEC